MPIEHKRKSNKRGLWINEGLDIIKVFQSGKMGVNATSRSFDIPVSTLRRWIKNNDYSNEILGLFSLLSMENKKKFKIYIKQLQKCGFTPTCECVVRSMIFNLAENLINHKFFKYSKSLVYSV